MDLSVDADISASEDLLGKTVDDLQSNVAVSTAGITGTLKYVTDYTGFSGDVSEQSGNYLALHMEAVEGATIKVELLGGYHGEVTLDEDGLIILKIANTQQEVKVTVVKDEDSFEHIYSLSGLILEENA